MDTKVICTEMTVKSAGTVKNWEETSIKRQVQTPVMACIAGRKKRGRGKEPTLQE